MPYAKKPSKKSSPRSSSLEKARRAAGSIPVKNKKPMGPLQRADRMRDC